MQFKKITTNSRHFDSSRTASLPGDSQNASRLKELHRRTEDWEDLGNKGKSNRLPTVSVVRALENGCGTNEGRKNRGYVVRLLRLPRRMHNFENRQRFQVSLAASDALDSGPKLQWPWGVELA